MFGLWIPPRDFNQFELSGYLALSQWFDRYMVNYHDWWTGALQHQHWPNILEILTARLPTTKLWLQVGEEEILNPGSLCGNDFQYCTQYAPHHALAGIVQWDECAWNIQYRKHNCAAHGHRQFYLSDYQNACRRLRSAYPQVPLMDVEPVHILPCSDYATEVQYFGADAYGNDSDSYTAQYSLQYSNAQAIMRSHGTATPFIVLKYSNGRSNENILGGIRGAIAGGIQQIFFWADPSEDITMFTPSLGWMALTGAIDEWFVSQSSQQHSPSTSTTASTPASTPTPISISAFWKKLIYILRKVVKW